MYRNILVPVDVDDPANARRAIQQAGFLAKAGGGSVHLLYVRFSLPSTYSGLLPAGFDEKEKKECLAKLEAWKAELGLPDERATITLRRGSIASEVLDEARERQADLIVIGSHLPSLTSRILGSNAASIIRDAKISVLVVREDQ